MSSILMKGGVMIQTGLRAAIDSYVLETGRNLEGIIISSEEFDLLLLEVRLRPSMPADRKGQIGEITLAGVRIVRGR